jgi:hypothetical protein
VAKIIAALQSGTIPETISEWAFIDRGGELAPPETRRSYSWTARLWHPTARICPSFSHARDSTPQLCAKRYAGADFHVGPNEESAMNDCKTKYNDGNRNQKAARARAGRSAFQIREALIELTKKQNQ